MTSLIITLGSIAVEFAFWAAVAFIVGYTLLAPWWRSQIGWARISLDFGIALALSPSFIHMISGVNLDNAFFDWYDISAVFFVGCVSLWNLALVAREQIKGLKKGKHAPR